MLLFTNVSIVGDFQPESLWLGSQERWHSVAPEFEGASLVDLRAAFDTVIDDCIGDADTVGVSFSGGLDSFAVLSRTASLCKRSGRDCVAITANLTDDSGDSTQAVTSRLIRDGNIKCIHHVIDPGRSTATPCWTPFGPRLEAMPAVARQIADVAAQHGAKVLLHGNGSDGLLGTPRYLTDHLIGSMCAAKSLQYLRDALTQSMAPLRHELIASVARLLPPWVRFALYWASNWPELCDANPSIVLHHRFRSLAEEWSRQWIIQRIDSHIASGRSWAHADAWDSMFPHEIFPPAGEVHEKNPFLHPMFLDVAMRMPLPSRYDHRYTCAYHRQKSLVLALYDPEFISILPCKKQIFSCIFMEQQESFPIPELSIELDLVDADAVRSVCDAKVRHRVRAVEEWLRQASSLGYAIVDTDMEGMLSSEIRYQSDRKEKHMSMEFQVVVFDSDGASRSGIRVTADFGIMNGQASDYTDDNGIATIRTEGEYVTAEIFVDGSHEGEFSVSDGEAITINT